MSVEHRAVVALIVETPIYSDDRGYTKDLADGLEDYVKYLRSTGWINPIRKGDMFMAVNGVQVTHAFGSEWLEKEQK